MRFRRSGMLGATVMLAAAGGGCSGSSSGAAPRDGGADATADASADAAPTDAGGPVISNLMVAPNPNNTLSATVTFTTDRPATDQARAVNTADGGAGNVITTPVSSAMTTSHTLNLIGMRATSPFDITVTATDAQSRPSTATATFTSGALPTFVPPITVVMNDKTKAQPGYTLFTTWKHTGAPQSGADPANSFILAVDADFQVVWYYQTTKAQGFPWDVEKLPNGHMVFLTGFEKGWTEIDPMGNLVQSHTPASMGLDCLHHAIFPEPSGNYLSMSTKLQRVGGYPPPDGGLTYAVVGDDLVEFDRDGGLLGQWSTFDMAPQFDPHNEGSSSEFFSNFYDLVYPDAGATKDWIHGNSINRDPSDDTIVASSRTLSWVFKFATTGGGPTGTGPKVLWRLGLNGDFALTNTNDTFMYNQHGPYITPTGNIMLFDDGSTRPLAQGQQPWSRAMEFSLDLAHMQTTIVWQYQEPAPGYYSEILGSAYVLDNDNVLIDDGGELVNRTGSSGDATNLKFARIFEVTHTTPSVKVAEFDINVPFNTYPEDPTFSGFSVYRAIRVKSLY